MTEFTKKRVLIIGTDGLLHVTVARNLVAQLAQVKEYSELIQVDVQTSAHQRDKHPTRFGEFSIHYTKINQRSLEHNILMLWVFGLAIENIHHNMPGVSVGPALLLRGLFKFRSQIIVNVDGVEWRREK